MASNSKPTPLVAYPPSQDLLSALGITQDKYNNLDPDARLQVQYLQGLVGKLNTQDYDNALSTIQGQASDIFKATSAFTSGKSGTLQNLQSLVGGLQAQIPAGYQAPPSQNAAAQAAQAEQSANTVTGAAPIAASDLTGKTGTPNTLDWQQLQTVMGSDPKQAYQDYVNSLQQANKAGASTPGFKPKAIPSETDWFSQQIGNITAPYGPLIQSLNAQYLISQGTSMPLSLQSEVIAQINAMAKNNPKGYNELLQSMPNLQQTIATAEKTPTTQTLQTIGQAAAGIGFSQTGALSNLYNTFTENINAEPSPYYQQEQITAQNIAAFKSQTGLAATPDQVDQMRGMNAEELNNFIASQASSVPGEQIGTEQTGLKNMETTWQQYFHRNPNQSEIQYFSGWDKDSIQAWVDQQQSVDNPTMTVGERAGYLSNADAASQKLWGVPADSRMADLLDGHFNPNAAPPTTTPTNPIAGITKGLSGVSPSTTAAGAN